MKLRDLLITGILLPMAVNASAQSHHTTGCVVDSALYESVPRVKEQLERAMLPSAWSLRHFCPEAKSQSIYSTCTGWATAYAARTIAEAVVFGERDRSVITRDAYSPLFVYSSIVDKVSEDCSEGTSIESALLFMARTGCLKYSRMDDLCVESIEPQMIEEARMHRLDHYRRLFDWDANGEQKVRAVKKSISEGRPVVISMFVPESFEEDYGNEWEWTRGDERPGSYNGSDRWHAMCVVGYDDTRMDIGAFLLMNSWGEEWGDEGFRWVDYYDFAEFVRSAFEVYMNKLPTPPGPVRKTVHIEPIKGNQLDVPAPTPVPIHPEVQVTEMNQFNGSMRLMLSTGESIGMKKNKVDDTVYYHADGSYMSGIRYRVYLENNEPAFVYMLSTDGSGFSSILFPPDEHVSAELSYRYNSIAIPDESYYIEMGNVIGKDYICVLYSAEELDIKNIVSMINKERGSFYNRIFKVLGNWMCEWNDAHYDDEAVSFSALSKKTMVPVFIEMDIR